MNLLLNLVVFVALCCNIALSWRSWWTVLNIAALVCFVITLGGLPFLNS